jgi:hypothetical protein
MVTLKPALLLVMDAYSTYTHGSSRAHYFHRDHLCLP